jgi:hypothetical protein
MVIEMLPADSQDKDDSIPLSFAGEVNQQSYISMLTVAQM